jgi:hypothetical protein
MRIDLAVLGSAKFENGVSLWQASVPAANDNDDVESFGEVGVIQSLGVSSTPFPKDASGHAQGLICSGIPGLVGACLGARDLRNTNFLGKQSPGDTTLHATGPGAVAQCFVKNKKRQAGLATENSKNETMLFLLDGKNDKSQWACNGAIVEIDKKGRIILTAAGGAGLILDDKVYVVGEVSLPGMTAGNALMQGPPIPYVGGTTPTNMTPVKGVGP